MKASEFFIRTFKENPQDATVKSHQLMVRAGLIRKLGSGLYHWMPMGLISFRKIENIIRKEMNRARAVEFQLPILTPGEIWETSGRWETMGKEMFRLKDRHDVWNVLGPTHEESFTDLMKGILHSYRDLPVTVYQIHTKFRDEIRPRFGVMRSREFVMKDAYSFDRDEKDLDESYENMRSAYRRIFQTTGLKVLPVEADSGSMGGAASEEFMVPSDIGEEILLISENETYRGNQEKTPVVYPAHRESEKRSTDQTGTSDLEKIHTPGVRTMEDLARFLKVDLGDTIKTVALQTENDEPVLVCLRGDRSLNEVKLKNQLGSVEFQPASDDFIRNRFHSEPGFIGPQGMDASVRIFFDRSVESKKKWITGANERDYHVRGYTIPSNANCIDLALAQGGDPSPDGDGVLKEIHGIEVGHIFKLGDKYTRAFQLTIQGEDGKPVTPLMGCYGIGVNRTLAAVVEQNSDDAGIIWPISVAPFEFVIVSITKGEEEKQKAGLLYQEMKQSGLDVLWDDRDLRPGVRFADAELIGYPVRITLGKKYFEGQGAEIQIRSTGEVQMLQGDPEKIVQELGKIRDRLYAELAEALE